MWNSSTSERTKGLRCPTERARGKKRNLPQPVNDTTHKPTHLGDLHAAGTIQLDAALGAQHLEALAQLAHADLAQVAHERPHGIGPVKVVRSVRQQQMRNLEPVVGECVGLCARGRGVAQVGRGQLEGRGSEVWVLWEGDGGGWRRQVRRWREDVGGQLVRFDLEDLCERVDL